MRYPDLDRLVKAHAQDLSRGGMFLRAKRMLPVNAVVRLLLTLPESGGEVPVIARVAHVRDEEEARRTGKPSGIGVEFLDVSRDNIARIERFLEERTIEQAEKSGPVRVVGRLRILVVDDDATYREAAAAPFFERRDEILIANDGLEALALCLEQTPDVILSDVQMPRMDGWTFLRVLRARPSLAAVPVLFLTSLDSEEQRLKGYQLGVDDYITKPYAPGELVARALRAAIRARESRVSRAERKALRGDLAQVSLPSLLSFLELEHQTGVLLVVAERTGRLYVREGRPVAVELEPALIGAEPRELALELVGWVAGQFEFAAQDVSHVDNLQTTMRALILEHARRHDESAR